MLIIYIWDWTFTLCDITKGSNTSFIPDGLRPRLMTSHQCEQEALTEFYRRLQTEAKSCGGFQSFDQLVWIHFSLQAETRRVTAVTSQVGPPAAFGECIIKGSINQLAVPPVTPASGTAALQLQTSPLLLLRLPSSLRHYRHQLTTPCPAVNHRPPAPFDFTLDDSSEV